MACRACSCRVGKPGKRLACHYRRDFVSETASIRHKIIDIADFPSVRPTGNLCGREAWSQFHRHRHGD